MQTHFFTWYLVSAKEKVNITICTVKV